MATARYAAKCETCGTLAVSDDGEEDGPVKRAMQQIALEHWRERKHEHEVYVCKTSAPPMSGTWPA